MSTSGGERAEQPSTAFIESAYDFTQLLHMEPYSPGAILQAFRQLSESITPDPLYGGNKSLLVVALLADLAAETAHRNGYEGDARLFRETRDARIRIFNEVTLGPLRIATSALQGLADRGTLI